MRFLIITTVLTLFMGCNNLKEEKEYILQGQAFGTTYSIKYYAHTDFDAKKGIDSVIEVINNSVSTYIPNSLISKINKGDSTIVVDSIFKNVYLLSEKVYVQSNGYFDPTIGVLRNAYGFGEDAPIPVLDVKTLDSLKTYVGFNKVSLLENNKVYKKHQEIYFDFNAIAKGYGIDCIGNYLESMGVNHFLIELGGELLSKGENIASKKPWVVGVESINSSLTERLFTAKLTLKNKGLASSGNYRKFRVDTITGKKYVHTINPLTGLAEENNITSATVLANNCALADAYATTFMAMGLDKSKQLLQTLSGVEAYLTFIDNNQNPQSFITEGFKEFLLD